MTAKTRVLVVDGAPVVLELVARVLDEAGYLVHACADAAAAEAVLARHEIDLLVTSKNLGTTTGMEVARRARERLPGLPVVLMTGPLDLHPVTAFKFEGYLVTPPTNAQAIHQAVAAALDSDAATRRRNAPTLKLDELVPR